MSVYAQVSYGSQGDTVKTLQSVLNNKGYSLDVDGIFGPKTLAAVKDYQSKNSLDVDGIVGPLTWGSLTAESSAAAPAAEKKPTGTFDVLSGVSDETASRLTSLAGGYSESAGTAEKRQAYEDILGSAPGAFSSGYSGMIDTLIEELGSRGEFSYDPFEDPAFMSYRRMYENDGRMAMMDAMGAAAGLTGGYGSTYSQAAGQSAYRNYLTKLNELIPEFYDMAKGRYDSGTDSLLARLSAAGDMYDREYRQYASMLDAYDSRLAAARSDYADARDQDYRMYSDMLDYYMKLADMEQDQANFAQKNEWDELYDKWYSGYLGAKVGIPGMW